MGIISNMAIKPSSLTGIIVKIKSLAFKLYENPKGYIIEK
jgi:hypothetical protein